jgi:hypothetical protein
MSILQAARQMEVSAEAAVRLRADMAPQAAVQALLAAGHTQDALKLLARLLPKRYAVAWLCQCARDEALEAEDRAGASLAEQWVRDPSEPNRRAAFDFATAGGYRSLGAWLAAAAGWSGGSLAPASQATPVPPAEHLTARAAVAAINLLAARVSEAFEARRLAFIGHAVGLLEAERAGS